MFQVGLRRVPLIVIPVLGMHGDGGTLEASVCITFFFIISSLYPIYISLPVPGLLYLSNKPPLGVCCCRIDLFYLHNKGPV